MRQRALVVGILPNPYRVVEPGQEFDWPAPLKWAEPVDQDDAATSKRRRKPEQSDPAPSEPDPI